MTARPDDEIAKAVAAFWNADPYDPATNAGGMDEALDGSLAGHVGNFPNAVQAVGLMTLWTGEQAALAGQHAASAGMAADAVAAMQIAVNAANDLAVAAVAGSADAAEGSATAAAAAATSVQRGLPNGVAALDGDGKVPAGQMGPPPAHAHVIADTSGLQAALDGKLAQGKHTIWVPAAAMTPRTTNGAASGSVETTSNKIMRVTRDFDAATQEYAQFTVAMPKSWNEGTVSFQALWTSAAGSGGVAFGLHAVASGDLDNLDAAFGTGQIVTDTLGTAGYLHQTAESAAITVAGSPGEGKLVIFQLYRDVANGSDTLAQDALLLGVRLFYGINAGDDA